MGNDLEYAQEWYVEGCDKSKKPVVRFMLLWIAFSWIYESYQEETEGEELHAKDMIHKFCEKYYDDKLRFFPAHETEAYRQITKNPPKRGRAESISRGNSRSSNPRYRQLDKQQVESLLMKLYRVRCNLFHGSKRLILDRDLDLVRWSATILEGYLGTIFG